MSSLTTTVALLAGAVLFLQPMVLAGEDTGRLAIALGEKNQVLFVSPEGAVLGKVPVGIQPRGMAVRQGKLFVANRGLSKAPGSSLSVIDLATLKPERTILACVGCAPYALVFDRQGQLWYTGQGDRALYVMEPPYEVAGGAIILAWGWPTEVAVIDSSDHLIVAVRASTEFAVVNTLTRTFERVAFGPTPSHVFTRPGTAEGWVVAEDMGFLGSVTPGTDGGAPEFESFKIADTISDALFLPGGKQVVLSASRPKVIGLVDAQTRKASSRLDLETPPGLLAISPDGTQIALSLPGERNIAIVSIAGDGALTLERRFEIEGDVKSMLWLDAQPSRTPDTVE